MLLFLVLYGLLFLVLVIVGGDVSIVGAIAVVCVVSGVVVGGGVWGERGETSVNVGPQLMTQ